jgi:16S rRNA (adenine1518-N6/adenine1519-N6)-dimethyltransferase
MCGLSMCSKHLGQHFLINQSVSNREIEYAQIRSDDIVLEIGPGKGVLTRLLAQKAQQVIAIELDKNLVSYLKGLVPDNVMIVHADAAKVDFNSLPSFSKIVSNLPYQISSPITFKLLDLNFERAVLIYQKEFANRMVAPAGESAYSRLSVGVYYKALCSIREVIPPGCFFPPPLVDSAMVELIPRKEPPFYVKNERFFFEVTRLLFNHRRKKVKTVLTKQFGVPSDSVVFGDKRVEVLTPEQIAEISDSIFDFVKEG